MRRYVAVAARSVAGLFVGPAGAEVQSNLRVSTTSTQQTLKERDGQHDFDFETGTWKTHLKLPAPYRSRFRTERRVSSLLPYLGSALAPLLSDSTGLAIEVFDTSKNKFVTVEEWAQGL